MLWCACWCGVLDYCVLGVVCLIIVACWCICLFIIYKVHIFKRRGNVDLGECITWDQLTGPQFEDRLTGFCRYYDVQLDCNMLRDVLMA